MPTAPTNQKPKALVVDDEQVIADTLAIILNQAGFDASAVYTGKGAVEAARQRRPAIIISDVMMPDMNGIEAAIPVPAKRRVLTDAAERKREPAGTSLKCWPNPCTRKICWPRLKARVPVGLPSPSAS